MNGELQPVALVCREIPPAQFAGLRAAWNELVFAARRPNPFLSWEWLQSWIETRECDEPAPWILGVWSADRLVGAVPLARDGSTVRFLGVAELVADFADVLAVSGAEKQILDAIAAMLRDAGDWSQFIIEGCAPDAWVAQLADALAGEATVQREPCGVCPVLELAGSWEDMLKRRFEKKRRYNIQRDMRLAGERHGLTVHAVEDAALVAQAMETTFRLHRARKAIQGIATRFADGRIAQFHRIAASRFHAAGWLALDLIKRGETELAALYGFQFGRSFFLYQTGLDAAGHECGAGSFALSARIARSADAGLAEFDFLRGDEPYKALWAERRTELSTFKLFRRTFRGRAAYLALRLRSRLAPIARRLLRRS